MRQSKVKYAKSEHKNERLASKMLYQNKQLKQSVAYTGASSFTASPFLSNVIIFI